MRDLHVTFTTDSGTVEAVRGVSWDLAPGEVLGVVGESGSGKSVTMSTILRLLRSPPATVRADEIVFDGRDLLQLTSRQMRLIRGNDIAMIFQDPMTSFNPVQTIGHQIVEATRVHDRAVSRRAARQRAVELLDLVGVPSASTRVDQYPHEFSGGMRQRAMIAMAIVNRPKVLIADEPTTALDVTIQAQILDVLESMRAETGAAMILITHDLGLVAETVDRVLVMYGGRIVERATATDLFRSPKHPYTVGLLQSLPRIDHEVTTMWSIPGQPPSLNDPPSGCYFHPRCERGRDEEICRTVDPELITIADRGHEAACHFVTPTATPVTVGSKEAT